MKRMAKLLLPLVATVGVLAGTVGVAHAGSRQTGQAYTNACYMGYSWNSTTAGWWTDLFSCYWDGFILCGVYGDPGTYNWATTGWINDQSGHGNHLTSGTPLPVQLSCAGGQTILNVGVSVWAGYGWRCFFENTGFWVTNQGFPCGY